MRQFDGLLQERLNPSTLAMELRLFVLAHRIVLVSLLFWRILELLFFNTYYVWKPLQYTQYPPSPLCGYVGNEKVSFPKPIWLFETNFMVRPSVNIVNAVYQQQRLPVIPTYCRLSWDIRRALTHCCQIQNRQEDHVKRLAKGLAWSCSITFKGSGKNFVFDCKYICIFQLHVHDCCTLPKPPCGRIHGINSYPLTFDHICACIAITWHDNLAVAASVLLMLYPV